MHLELLILFLAYFLLGEVRPRSLLLCTRTQAGVIESRAITVDQ